MTACSWFETEEEPKTIELDQKSVQMVNGSNQFGLNLFETIMANENEKRNVMISPLSISQALSMTLNGADGNSYIQMQQTLAYNDLSLEEINKANQNLVNALVGHDKKVTLNLANSIWYRNDFTPLPLFVSSNKSYYNAEVNSYDPSKPGEACSKINKWVDENTKGKIEKIIDEVKPENVMFLINATYFKASWKTEFKKSNTSDRPFTLEDGTVKQIPTMIGEVKLSYHNDETFSAIKLPYGSGKFNLFVFLPEEGYSIGEIIPSVKTFNFDILDGVQLSEREIWLPKFEFSYERILNNDLMELGMTDPFNPSVADFRKIGNIDLFISKVKHKTYIKTDEEGTEAAAATSVNMDVTSIGPDGLIKIDHSFLFAIGEEDTNSILFLGKVFDPSLTE